MSKATIHVKDSQKELISLITRLGNKYSNWQVFQDFLELSAISISNAVDFVHREEREKTYLGVVKKYSRAEIELFTQMLAALIKSLETEFQTSGPCDVLGEVFHALELHNKYHGQFFTPFNICEMMGRMSIGDAETAITSKGYVTVSEPCVGSGGTVLGFAAAMQNIKLDYSHQMCATCCDIDLKCVHMAYLQLSLYGIPAIIVHGNTLTLEEWSVWYTPTYILDGWAAKPHGENEKPNKATVAPEEPQAHSPECECAYEYNESNGQLSLF